MAKGKKNKVNLEKIAQTHGALKESKSVNELLGMDSGYAEKSADEYMSKINAMTDSDLHEHAVEVGVVPMSNTVLLKDRLERQFLAAQSKFVYRTNPDTMSKENKKILENILKGAI